MKTARHILHVGDMVFDFWHGNSTGPISVHDWFGTNLVFLLSSRAIGFIHDYRMSIPMKVACLISVSCSLTEMLR
jgi:hypothetical protein